MDDMVRWLFNQQNKLPEGVDPKGAAVCDDGGNIVFFGPSEDGQYLDIHAGNTVDGVRIAMTIAGQGDVAVATKLRDFLSDWIERHSDPVN